MGKQQDLPMMAAVKEKDPIIVRHKGGHIMTAFFVKFLDAKRFVLKFEMAGERVVFLSSGEFEVKRQKERGMLWWSVDHHDLDRIRAQYAKKAGQKKK